MSDETQTPATTKRICSTSNVVKLAAFCMAALFSTVIVAFCCAKLLGKLDEGEKALYVSLMTTITSIWLPSPSAVMNIKTRELETLDKRIRLKSIRVVEDDPAVRGQNERDREEEKTE